MQGRAARRRAHLRRNSDAAIAGFSRSALAQFLTVNSDHEKLEWAKFLRVWRLALQFLSTCGEFSLAASEKS
jgi:hypothetical protein